MKNQKIEIYDYIVVGSGFGGSVSAMRLAEKGYRVLVLEKGKRYENKDFAITNYDVKKYLWLPVLRCFGIQEMTIFKDVFIVRGVGVGGGSLVYANTHVEPPDAFYNHAAWAKMADWRTVLQPFMATAKRMLGTTRYQNMHREDEILCEIAEDMGREAYFDGVEVGVYFGDKDTPTDPYFGGEGPMRTGCQYCAGCLVGCRFGAKNTLDKNYLWFAEKYGATILPETTVEKIEFENGIYTISTTKSTAFFSEKNNVFQAKGIVMSAGVIGSMEILLKQKHHYKTLPNLSDTLGERVRTNSESICGVGLTNEKLNNGIAISSIFQADEHTHVEVFKFPNGSGFMGRLGVMAASESSPVLRFFKFFYNILRHPITSLRLALNFEFASNSVLLLVMQSLDNQVKLRWNKGFFGFFKRISLETGEQGVPAFLPIAQDISTRFAEKTSGTPLNAVTEIFLNMSTTAHVLGGCPMAETAAEGVINADFAAHGYPRFYILDGSVIQGNLGVNPSLTITTLAEYAMSKIERKG